MNVPQVHDPIVIFELFKLEFVISKSFALLFILKEVCVTVIR
jgi:hypothetical protein